MKPSLSKYGKYYDKEFVQQHAVLFKRQALWAKQVLDDELKKPFGLYYFDFTTMSHRLFPVRNESIVNQAINDIKWNEAKFEEAFIKEIQ